MSGPSLNAVVFASVDLSEFPLVKQWVDQLRKRIAFQKGLTIPFNDNLKQLSEDKNFIAGNRELIRQGMEWKKEKNRVLDIQVFTNEILTCQTKQH
jgi:hypothetical protein